MIDNVNIPAAHNFVPQLRVVKRPGRLREHIDRKHNYLVVKRIFDILISLLAIFFILSWLVPLLYLVIRLDSRGSLFFLQKRIGLGGRSFYCIKFRTMVMNGEKDERPAMANDERVTRVGRILRRSNLDEFPQFFNVLLGEMSFIGPRPHMFADCNRFAARLPEYKFRNMVRPGLTGLAQVKGYHGPAVTHESIAGRYRWDKYYIENISSVVDAKILVATVFKRAFALFAYLFGNATSRTMY